MVCLDDKILVLGNNLFVKFKKVKDLDLTNSLRILDL